jgi:hypothetical protein
MKSRTLTGFAAMTLFAALSGVALANPVPLVNQPLLPATVKPGSAGFTLTVTGTGFVSGSTVNWNGTALVTAFVSRSRLTASVPPANITKAGTASVTVVSPGPGGGKSNVVFFQIRAAGTWAAFGAAAHFTAGAGPESLVTGDFNGDHKLDLAVPNPNSNNVSILLGNGNGTFRPAVDYSVGQSPVTAAAGDFNRDGKLDLVVANNVSNNVSVLLGNGDGTFRTAVEHSVGQNPVSVAVGDFNRDGKLDAVVTDAGSNKVTVLLGNGAGSFQSAVAYSVGQNPVSVAAGDFNRDGKLDLVVANHDSNNVSVLLGNGDGTFRAAVNYGGTPNAASAAIADFNGDGKLDVVVTNAGGFDVAVLLGNGDGSFQSPATYSTGYEPSLALGDLNGDGKLDFAIANIGVSSVTTLLGNGNGSFQETVSYTVPAGVTSIALGDFNGDGKLDLAVPDGASGISILLQTQPLSGPNATLSSTSLPFVCRNVINAGCQCLTQHTLTLSNYGNQTLNIDGITITGPFSEGNNCGSSLKPGQFCSISVRWFELQGSGFGTLSVRDNASGSPQTVSLIAQKLCTPLAKSNTINDVPCYSTDSSRRPNHSTENGTTFTDLPAPSGSSRKKSNTELIAFNSPTL